MHPEVSWMIYRAEASDRQQRLQQRQHQHLLAYPCLQRRVAFWSGQYLLQCAHWLLRYGQQYEQWELSMQGVERKAHSWGR